jgi:hypothetical protein
MRNMKGKTVTRNLDWGPFANDALLGKEIERLIKKYDVQSAVETGTYQGETARGLADMVPQVYTIEVNPESFEESQERLSGLSNVTGFLGDSEVILPDLIPKIKKPALYYLDAHWNGHYPLPAEVSAIAEYDPSPIIVIHDMTVPDCPGLHADPQESGDPYDLDYIQPALDRMKKPYKVYYNNDDAEGLRIGIMFIVPEG